MARVYTEGFEGGDLLGWSEAASASNTSANARSGLRALLVQNTGNGITRVLPSTYSELFCRTAWRPGATALTSNSFFQLKKGGTLIADIVSFANGSLSVRSGGSTTLFTTAAGILAPLTQFLIELRYLVHDSTGVATLRVDGIERGTFTGDTKPGADTTIDSFRLAQNATSEGTFDDVAVNDTSGGVDNSWCGDGRIIGLKPNAAGNYTQWNPSAGANYTTVDEVPANSDTDYNSESVVNDKDSYNLEPCGLTGVTIKRVWIEMVARNTVADGSQARMFLRTYSTDYNDAAGAGALTGSYARYVTSDWLTNPNTVAAWTTTELDALEEGVEVI